MERVKRNADREQNVEMRWLVDDADAREQPLKILKQKISVFEKPEHAEVHANACDEPPALRGRVFRLGNLSAEPEIQRGRGKEKGGKRRIPCAVENVTGDDEQVLPRRPGSDAPVKRDDDYKENDESERIKKHGESSIELRCRDEQPIYASHIEGGVLDVVVQFGKIDPLPLSYGVTSIS
jgi:hypothetical protein